VRSLALLSLWALACGSRRQCPAGGQESHRARARAKPDFASGRKAGAWSLLSGLRVQLRVFWVLALPSAGPERKLSRSAVWGVGAAGQAALPATATEEG